MPNNCKKMTFYFCGKEEGCDYLEKDETPLAGRYGRCVHTGSVNSIDPACRSLHAQSECDCNETYNDQMKLRAFCEGLELQNIDKLMEKDDPALWRRLGEAMAVATKSLAARAEQAELLNAMHVGNR